jgi:hypothetical protein
MNKFGRKTKKPFQAVLTPLVRIHNPRLQLGDEIRKSYYTYFVINKRDKISGFFTPELLTKRQTIPYGAFKINYTDCITPLKLRSDKKDLIAA